jgi:hypothetical protein
MDDIRDSELVGDWLLTGGQLRIGLHLHQDGGYAFEQLATDAPHFDQVTASHSGTWATLPAVMPGIHLPQLWLHLTVRDSAGRQSGNQFAWPNDANNPDIVMLLVQKHAPGVFNVIDTFDGQLFSTIMILSDRHEPEKPASAQAAASTRPPVTAAPAAPVPAPPVPVAPASQEEVLAGLQAELEKLRGSLTEANGPSLKEQVDTMRQQLKDKQDALAISRQTDALDAEKKRLSAQKDLLDAQADAESARAKVRQAQAAQEAQIRQIQMQTTVDDAKAAADLREIQAGGDTYAYTVNQDIYARGVDARNKANDAFMRAMFRY